MEPVDNPFAHVRAALFDLDGTLIQTEIDFDAMRRAMRQLALRYGIRVDPTERDVLAIVEEARAALAREGDPAQAAALRKEAFAALEAIEERHVRDAKVAPGAAALIRHLHRRSIRIGIVTRNCRRVSEQLVRMSRLPYDALVTRDDVERTKPHPDHLMHTLRLLGMEHLHDGPAQAVIIGDHWMDIQAGRAAGLFTVGILLGRDGSFFAPAMPDLLVNELADLLPLATQGGSAACLFP
ncbi:MAG: HAD family hydrolase [Chthonomonadales bacterium]